MNFPGKCGAVLIIDRLGQLRRKPGMCVMSEKIGSGSRRNLKLRQVSGLDGGRRGSRKSGKEVDGPLYCRQLAGKILLDWRLRAVNQNGEASYWYSKHTFHRNGPDHGLEALCYNLEYLPLEYYLIMSATLIGTLIPEYLSASG